MLPAKVMLSAIGPDGVDPAAFARVFETGRPDAMAVQRHPIRRPAEAGGAAAMSETEPGEDGEHVLYVRVWETPNQWAQYSERTLFF